MRTVTVVGASLAGLYAARELRAQGFDGRLFVVGAEPHPPYDRPPLSKEFLTGGGVEDRLTLADPEETAELGAEWVLGTRARALDTRGRAVVLDDGRTLASDGVVIATGASARRLPGPALTGVHTLRTLDDARALRAELVGGPRRVVVIGGGFIGAETASSCVALGHDVTVVEAAPLPLAAHLGTAMATVCAALHARGGARLLTRAGVAALRGDAPTAFSGGAVTAVELSDGRLLPADVVVVGIGATPNTGWLAGSPLALDDGVLCDDGCVTALPQVVAVGDVARSGGIRAEHWTSATEQPRVVVRNLLAGHRVETVRPLPYFWSDQYGSRIQFAGRRRDGDTVRIVEGSPEAVGEGGFLAVYERAGRRTAALAVDRLRPCMKARRQLAAAETAETAAAAKAAEVEEATGAQASTEPLEPAQPPAARGRERENRAARKPCNDVR
ncbi:MULTISPECIES: NAD(P)/FAD-dependent oxidoreductase [Streptomyces]|uniref:NAD(P)/FAD-dependent oxidoreductase n=1 Tax=Streptomyces TaxID=1883 RepID=UPI001E417C72|nr:MULTISPECIES: FAD-dependent oxidoreductase [Streptomyces]UFQ14430.1 FAD-dependent oxidoreductase [Streptomyces huasconensis]WCL89685.1 FAD-dependent oxidoreductase [Streptomyces sp. JCM 35825]